MSWKSDYVYMKRARMANEIANLKEEAAMFKQTNLSQCPSGLSPGARNSRILALENMLASSSSTLVSMASQLSDAEECERDFSGRGCWNQVRSLVDAKNIMNSLLNLASSSKCLLRDKEVECKEKDTEIRDLKEKVVKLSTMARHLEKQIHQVKSQNSALKRYSTRGQADNDEQNADGHKYDLRKLEQAPWRSTNICEDMDTSDSEHSDKDVTDDEWGQSRKPLLQKRTFKFGGSSSAKGDMKVEGTKGREREQSGGGQAKFDWETGTLEEWFDYMEEHWPRQIIQATEEMIEEMRRKAGRVGAHILWSRKDKGVWRSCNKE